MLDDFNDILRQTDRPLESLRLDPIIDSAAKLAGTNPLDGLSTLITAGSLIEKSMAKTAGLLANLNIPEIDLTTSLSSLGKLKAPYEMFAALGSSEPYLGTIHSLASVAKIADTISAFKLPGLDTLSLEGLAMKNLGLPATITNELGIAQSLTSPYMASAASVLSLESSYVGLLGAVGHENLLSGIPFESIDYLRNNVASLSLAVKETWDVIGKAESIWDRASFSMLRAPGLELYIDIHAVGAITLIEQKQPKRNDEIEGWFLEQVDGFEVRLASLDSGLVGPYQGAIAAIKGGQADWQRHSMTSLRELTTHVLHLLAPDEDVLKSASERDLHDGRPTRRARLRYIFAAASGDEIAEFFEADMNAAMKMFDLLNSGTHKLGNKATPQQLHYLRGRVVGLIGSMLKAKGY